GVGSLDGCMSAKVSDRNDSLETFEVHKRIDSVICFKVSNLMAIQQGIRLGRYEIRSLLVASGMGDVYLAYDLNLHRQVAIKVLHADLSVKSSPSLFERKNGLRRIASRPPRPATDNLHI